MLNLTELYKAPACYFISVLLTCHRVLIPICIILTFILIQPNQNVLVTRTLRAHHYRKCMFTLVYNFAHYLSGLILPHTASAQNIRGCCWFVMNAALVWKMAGISAETRRRRN